MKPSHLAFLAMAGLGIGGMSSCSVASESIGIHSPAYQKIMVSMNAEWINESLIRGGFSNGNAPPGSWRKKNQRQIRLARRRKHASGHKNAFS